VAALAEAGAHVDTVADWHSNVIVDRELITGQQPMSASEFADALLAKFEPSLAHVNPPAPAGGHRRVCEN
jgi:putative intracellular protease/amidase